jgi:Zn-dependent peptidase ImmA (M78 family)
VKFLRNDELEAHTAGRLAEYERKTGRKVEPPVQVEKLAEVLFDLRFSYEPLDVPLDMFGPAALRPELKTIIVNEIHRAVFTEKPGVERFSVGHEVGHWDLFEKDKDTRTGFLFGHTAADSRVDYRTPSGVPVKFIKGLWTNDGKHEVLSFLQRTCDAPDVASAVNRYASALLMPKYLLLPVVNGIDATRWSNLYRVAEQFGVTISALTTRLRRLGHTHVTEDGKPFSGTKEEHAGQQRMFSC